MLTNLYIENIAVIEKTNIEFKPGLNVLTGETGAGKSILIDAINTILGMRTPREIIRTGADSAFVSVTFENLNSYIIEKLKDLGYVTEDGLLMIQRELSLKGGNRCRINGRPATVSNLRELGGLLVNIHGQNDSQDLSNPELHIDFIDDLSNNNNLLNEYTKVYKEYNEAKRKVKELDDDESLRLQQIDLLEYQINELKEANLDIDEYENLNSERDILINSEHISKMLLNADLSLSGSSSFKGAIELTENAAESILKILDYIPKAEEVNNKLYDIIYNLKDCQSEMNIYYQELENNPIRLNEIEERLDLINRLSKKYGSTIKEMNEFLDNSKKELKILRELEINKDELKIKEKSLYNKAVELAIKLSENRKKAILIFEKQVKKELTFLDMPKVNLVLNQEKTKLNNKGHDKIEMLISVNPGEPPKPVAKIASGGELSRMMLAIKTVLSKSKSGNTLIFDEIDTGISGSAAHKVGLKLKKLSKENQIICVTHQGQIAAFADNHYLIKKEFLKDKTYTSVKALNKEGQKNELARIISGSKINESALEFAQELIDSALNSK